MMKNRLFILFAITPALLFAQQTPDLQIEVRGEQGPPTIAVPDLRGTVDAEAQDTFNTTLWNDLEASGALDMISKSFYPRTAPQRPEDMQFDVERLPENPGDQGLFVHGWSQPPVATLYLVMGKLEAAGDRFVLNGWLVDVTQETSADAYQFGKRYYGDMNEAGTRQVAHDFSRDILQNLGLGVGLAGTRIYFVSDRNGQKEIYSIDYDGANLRQLTNFKNLTIGPSISPDGSRLAYTTFVEGTPKIYMQAMETGRRLTFYNQTASLNTTPTFTSDGTLLYYASSITGHTQIYRSDLDGKNLSRISYSRSIAVDPTVNPKTGAQIAYVDDRSGLPQVYLMDSDGANVRRLSLGGGQAEQPAWDPQGENVAFAWTRGFEPGNYNIFVVNVATQNLVQLTHGAGRNESPSFSPSGTHIVFSSDRSGGSQLWTMRADGTQLRKLTTRGRNVTPVWGVR